jgi:hypothetical protein
LLWRESGQPGPRLIQEALYRGRLVGVSRGQGSCATP